MNYETQYLSHHGVLGMKWGVRRYQNKDGSLTSEGKRHISSYRKKESKRKKLNQEGQTLISSSKRLQKDFGNSYRNVDDDALLEFQAREYGLNTDKFWSAKTDYTTFVQNNRKSIAIGEKLVKKYGYK